MMIAAVAMVGFALIASIIFSKEVKQFSLWLFGKVSQWVKTKKPPSPTKSFFALLMLVGLGVVVIGTYEMNLYNLQFTLPIEDPRHIAFSTIVLAFLIGLLLKVLEGAARIFPAIMTIALIGQFAGETYIQTSENINMSKLARGEDETEQLITGTEELKPGIAALRSGVMMATEVGCSYGMIVLGWEALSYLWLIFLLPITPFLGIACLAEAGKSFPGRLTEWKTERKEQEALAYLRTSELTPELTSKTVECEPLETERVVVRQYNDTVREATKKRYRMVRTIQRVVLFWIRIWTSLLHMFRGASFAKRLSERIFSSQQKAIDECVGKVEERVGGKGNPSKKRVTDAFTIGFLVIILNSSAEASDRYLKVLLDITGSYQFTERSVTHVQNIVEHLGPNDRGDVTLLGNFIHRPSYIFRFPRLPIDIETMQRKNIYEWKKDVLALQSAWRKSNAEKQELSKWLSSEIKRQDKGGTFWHDMLSYSAVQFSQLPDSVECTLIVISDLLHEDGILKTRGPPKEVYKFPPKAKVAFLMVPFEDYESWREMEESWRMWFESAGLASGSFQMLDVASTEVATEFLAKSSVPKTLKPFKPVLFRD